LAAAIALGISVLLGNGDGTSQSHVDYPAGSELSGVAVGDFNQDGHPDVVATGSFTYEVAVFLRNGDGTLKPGLDYSIPLAKFGCHWGFQERRQA
jgi:hypothetical protein